MPRPVPGTCVVRLSSARVKGLNITCWNSSLMPMPLSSMMKRKQPSSEKPFGSSSISKRILPPSLVYLIEFVKKFISIC